MRWLLSAALAVVMSVPTVSCTPTPHTVVVRGSTPRRSSSSISVEQREEARRSQRTRQRRQRQAVTGAEVIDMRVGDDGVPLVAARIALQRRELDLIYTPTLNADWIRVVLRDRAASLRGCAEMVVQHGDEYTSSPLGSFDRAGREVTYDLPLSGVVRAAASPRVQVSACRGEWTLSGDQLGELRRMVLLALYRRTQSGPALVMPTLDDGAGDAPPPLRARFRISGQVYLTLAYDVSSPDEVRLGFVSNGNQPDFPTCDVGLEAGPAAIDAERLSVAVERPQREMHWRVLDMQGFFALGVTDHAQLNFCRRSFDLSRVGGMRRFILISLLRQAASNAGRADVSLPPAERGDGQGWNLPSGSAPPGGSAPDANGGGAL